MSNPVAKLSLSEAIKLGAARRPQTFGRMAAVLPAPGGQAPLIGTCALGAAFDGAGLLKVWGEKGGTWISVVDKRVAREYWPLLTEPAETLPCGCAAGMAPPPHLVEEVIAHLNDTHEWRRELIAQWIGSLERK